MRRSSRPTVLWGLVLLVAAGRAECGDIALLPGDAQGKNVTALVEVNPYGGVYRSIDDVLTPAGRADFANIGHPSLRLGIRAEAFWLRLRVVNQTSTAKWALELSNPRLDAAYLYTQDDQGVWMQSQSAGSRAAHIERPLMGAAPAFVLSLPKNAVTDLYVLVEHEGSQRLQVFLRPLRLQRAHAIHVAMFTLMTAGGLFIMAVYNFLVFVGLRERAYLFLVLFIVVFAVFHMASTGMDRAWASLGFAGWPAHAAEVAAMLSIAAALLFTNAALNGPEVSPVLSRIVLGLAAAAIAGALVAFTDSLARYHICYAVGFAMPFGALPLAVAALRRNYRPARFFLVAWGLAMVGGTVVSLLALGYAPLAHPTEHALQAAFLLAVVLWSSALTDRVRFREEQLEHAVDERTAELRDAVAQVKTLSGMLPICCHCKKIRDDQGYWNQIDEYIQKHTEVDLSHGLCPDCARELYPDFMGEA